MEADIKSGELERYFTPNDILLGYKGISKQKIKQMCFCGELKHEKLFSSLYDGKTFEYVIPESELYKLAQYRLSEPRYMEEHQPSYIQRRKKETARSREVQEQMKEAFREGVTKKEAYHEIYLHSEHWQKKRKQVLERANYKCQICGSALNIRVHHVNYDNLGSENPDDLIAVCDKCHAELHEKDKRKKTKEPHIVRNVRMSLSLDNKIRTFAESEGRTISNAIQRLLTFALENYQQSGGLIHEETL